MIHAVFLKLVCAIIGLSLLSIWTSISSAHLPAERSHQLTFYSRRDGNFEIYLADIDRGLVMNISRHDAEDTLPAWSPDGEQLVFYSTRGLAEGLYRIASDGQPALLFTESGQSETYPLWSTDGHSIIYSFDRRGGVGIYTISVSGGQPTRISDDLAALMTYSPDGRQIGFMADCDNNCDLFLMDADGGNVRTITRNGLFDVFPAWSPDSRSIVFMSNRDRFFELYVAAADCVALPGGCNNNLQRLTDNRDFDGFPVWSPDGKNLLFSSDRDGNFELYLLDAACISQPDTCEQTMRRLTYQPAHDISPSWSPDGRWIAFISGRAVYVMDHEGGSMRQIMDDVLPDQFLVWRP